MHYKKFDQSPAYFGYHASTNVRSFKEVEKEAAKDPSAWDRNAGILLGTKDKPPHPPGIAENVDFNEKIAKIHSASLAITQRNVQTDKK